MKTICLVTSEESFMNNCGAALQGYALYHVLSQKGFDVRILKYKGGMKKENTSFFQTIYRNVIKVYKSIKVSTVNQNIYKLVARIYRRKYSKQLIYQSLFFKSFYDTMKYFDGERMTWETLIKSIPSADIYICGSDQIWNPQFKGGKNDLGYFLFFAPTNAIKIAFAPSFGVNKLPISAQTNIRMLLNRFDAISVREKTGQTILHELGYEVPVLADPVMLLSKKDWLAVVNEKPLIAGDYIFVYLFSNDFNNKKYIQIASQTLNCRVISLPLSGVTLADNTFEKIFSAGPVEFVNLIHHARLVCTDSFHATVFSLILNTPFISFLKKQKTTKSVTMNSRLTDLLADFSLMARIVKSKKDFEKLDLVNINFVQVNTLLSQKRKMALDWLSTSLRETAND